MISVGVIDFGSKVENTVWRSTMMGGGGSSPLPLLFIPSLKKENMKQMCGLVSNLKGKVR
jgi:hypothetical protein